MDMKAASESQVSAPQAAATKQVLRVRDVDLFVLKRQPPVLTIVAAGEVPTPGWTDAELVPFVYIQPPPDGIYDFDFEARPPQGIVTEVITPIKASELLSPIPSDLKGVRIHAQQNAIVAMLRTPSLPQAIFRSWKHSREEDCGGVLVFRPSDTFDFPPAFFRDEMTFRENGRFSLTRPGPADAPQTSLGTWQALGSDRIRIEFANPQQRPLNIQIVAIDETVLMIRRSRAG